MTIFDSFPGAPVGDVDHEGDGLSGVHGVLPGRADGKFLGGEIADGMAVLREREVGEAHGQSLLDSVFGRKNSGRVLRSLPPGAVSM